MKQSLVIPCGCLLPLALVVSRGPRHDTSGAAEPPERASRKARPKRLFADKGSDAERVHEFSSGRWRVRIYIPVAVKRRDGTVGGRCRSRVRTASPRACGKGWHAGAFMCGPKRTAGSALTARRPNTLDAEAGLRVLAYAVRR